MLILHGFVNITRSPGVREVLIPVGDGLAREVIHPSLSEATHGRCG